MINFFFSYFEFFKGEKYFIKNNPKDLHKLGNEIKNNRDNLNC